MNRYSSAPRVDPSDDLLDAALAHTLVPPTLSPDFQTRLYAALASQDPRILGNGAVQADIPCYMRRNIPVYERLRFILWGLLRVAVCFGVLTFVIVGALHFVGYQKWQTYTTQTERQIIRLPQGASITLDASSQLHIWRNRFAWVVRLERGRVSFDLRHDPSRQLTVIAGDATVIDLGTQFQVAVQLHRTEVLVTEGVVEMGAVRTNRIANTKPRVVATSTIRGGEVGWTERVGDAVQLHVSTLRKSDIQRRASWASGYLMFDHVPLPLAVAELNRYNRCRITVDGSARDVTIGGVIRTGDVAGFMKLLQKLHPELMTLNIAPDEILITRH